VELGHTTTTCDSTADIDAYIKRIKVLTWVIAEHLDFDKYFEKPTSPYLQNHGTHVLNPLVLQTSQLLIRYNEIESKDGWVQIGLEGTEYEFFDIKEQRQFIEASDETTLLCIEFSLTSERR